MFNSIRSIGRLLSLAATLQQVNAFRPMPEYQAAVIKVMSSFLSPANQEQANAINSTLLADDVVIRVDVTENYIGREKGTEYIWGLFAKSEQGFKNGTTQLIPFPISSTLQSVVFQPPMVASSVIVNFTYPTIDYYLPVQIDQFIRFDNQDLTITSWDITFRRFAEAFYLAVETTPLVKQIAKELDIKLQPNTNVTDVLAQHAVKEICRVHEEECHGANQQYKSQESCYKSLTKKKFGQPWQGGQDTIFCRYLHRYMIPLRPSVHCPHISLSGGGMCSQNSYVERVLSPPFTEPLIGGL